MIDRATSSTERDNMSKALNREPVSLTISRLAEMQEEAIACATYTPGLPQWRHWHWAAAINELIALRSSAGAREALNELHQIDREIFSPEPSESPAAAGAAFAAEFKREPTSPSDCAWMNGYAAGRRAPEPAGGHGNPCPNCEQNEVGTFHADQWFLYGSAQHRLLAANVEFFRCMACGCEFTGEDGEQKRNQAVRDFLSTKVDKP